MIMMKQLKQGGTVMWIKIAIAVVLFVILRFLRFHKETSFIYEPLDDEDEPNIIFWICFFLICAALLIVPTFLSL